MKNGILLLFFCLSLSMSSWGQSTCSEAVTATTGTNSLPATTNENYWYAYTMPSDGELQISSSSSEYVTIYGNTCGDLHYQGGGYSNSGAVAFSAGDEVFIQWDTYSGGDFEWDLTVTPLEPGEGCVSAMAATTGSNTLPATSNTYYWYTYTMPSDSKLQISSASSKYVAVYSNSCNNLHYEGDGHENATITTLASGDKVFIQWETNGEGNFNWDLSLSPLEAGDNCDFTATATSGTNSLPATTNEHYWYTYTMPSDGKLLINSSSSTYVEVYSNSCDDLHYVENGYGYDNVTVTTLNSGDQVFIKWYTYGNGSFDWDLSVSPLEAGDDCSLAATAITGTNSLPATLNAYYWYTYTMPSDGRLEISSATSNYVRVYSNSCEALSSEGSGSGNATITTLSSGDEVSIRWTTDASGNFDWDLAISPLEDGDNCDLAVTATMGTNTTPHAPYWFEYSAPTTGEYTISSVGTASNDTYLRVYADCEGTLIDSNDDFVGGQSQLTISLTAGDIIYILWDDTYSSGGFDWAISVEPAELTDQTITFDALPTKTLADAPFDLTATATSGLPVGYASSDETIATISGNTVTIVGVGTTTITASQAGDGTYSAAPEVARTLTVTKVQQTISIDAIDDQLIDASPITVNATTSSGLTLEYAITGPATISDNVITLEGTEGTVKVTVNQAGDDYYAAASANVSFTVTDPSLQDQTITFDSLSAKTLEDAAFDLTATASSGLPVSYSSSDEAVATISGSTVTIIGVGTTTITASQAGDDTYRAALSVTRPLTITGSAPEQTEVDCSGLTASISETVDIVCSGSTDGSLTVSVTGGQAPYRYSIDGTTFQETASFADLDAGKYVITVEDANGCSATVEGSISVPEALVVEGQINPSTEYPENGSISLSVSGGTAPYSYVWSNDATTATISDLVPGDYGVIVTDASGCKKVVSFSVGGVTSVEEIQQQNIAIYPNPVLDVLLIEIPEGSNVKSATLYNLLGKKIAEMNLVRGKNQINASALKSGTYLLKLEDGNSQRIIIK